MYFCGIDILKHDTFTSFYKNIESFSSNRGHPYYGYLTVVSVLIYQNKILNRFISFH